MHTREPTPIRHHPNFQPVVAGLADHGMGAGDPDRNDPFGRGGRAAGVGSNPHCCHGCPPDTPHRSPHPQPFQQGGRGHVPLFTVAQGLSQRSKHPGRICRFFNGSRLFTRSPSRNSPTFSPAIRPTCEPSAFKPAFTRNSTSMAGPTPSTTTWFDPMETMWESGTIMPAPACPVANGRRRSRTSAGCWNWIRVTKTH